MLKSIISSFFLITFLVFLTAPTIIIMVDDTVDVSCFYASAEEEEEKGHEKTKDKDVLFFEYLDDNLGFGSKSEKNNLGYYFKTYPKPHSNLVLPPPECIIL